VAGLRYHFGSADPRQGGLDCSGAVQHVMGRLGLSGMPRTASDQFLHLRAQGTLTVVPPGASAEWILRQARPGDLLFWRGTYDTGRWPDVSHVMIYLGFDRRIGKPMMFGASTRTGKGINGYGVDIYELRPPRPGSKGQLIGIGSIPGLNVPPRQWAVR
jgi:peptidoglycan DL-endopeptidase CwlO